MTLIFQTPSTAPAERDYILGLILGDWLGLPWRRLPGTAADVVTLRLDGAPGELRLPDRFLSQPAADWLTTSSLPTLPLTVWETRDLNRVRSGIRHFHGSLIPVPRTRLLTPSPELPE